MNPSPMKRNLRAAAPIAITRNTGRTACRMSTALSPPSTNAKRAAPPRRARPRPPPARPPPRPVHRSGGLPNARRNPAVPTWPPAPYFFPCSVERYSRIFAASASGIQSAFFACIDMMIAAHSSLFVALAVARSSPWHTLHFCSKRAFPSAVADTAGAGGFGASGLEQAAAGARTARNARDRALLERRIVHFLLSALENRMGTSYSREDGGSTGNPIPGGEIQRVPRETGRIGPTPQRAGFRSTGGIGGDPGAHPAEG